ncbi:4Fe-4S dicluster domain-containing protein [Lebetimonas sp. JS138]|uniref:4Fe-4S dicluster domain-containing protein n=1 Tax=Lebetimonas sp. JS138 TaxID=990072 RepID=UPI000463BB8F|nr:4Fe-4S dicluster domain-containing protein [Lebetimonas sp. JS138]
MLDKSKRNFFRRVTSPFKSFLYPPYYKKKEDFLNCIECNEKACVKACPEKIIKLNNEIPILNFAFNGCTFCDECAKACGKVLKTEYKKNKINAEFIINTRKCLAWNNTICYSCQDICEKEAIIYKGMFNPVIDLDKCTACGFCIGVCPNDSIELIVK